MKRSDLKELIKKSMVEVAPKKDSGAMTPEEEKMVADYDEEQANKYALDKEEPLEEILNIPDDIEWEWYGQDLDQVDSSSAEIGFEGYSPSTGHSFTASVPAYDNGGDWEWNEGDIDFIEQAPMEEDILREADEIVAAYAKKKLVKEALDFPRDAVQALADAYENIEKIYSTFGRDSRFKDEAKQDDYLMIKATLQSINNKLVGLDSDFGYGKGAKLGYNGLNEEMHGGYLELFEMNPAFEEGVASLLEAWNEWKQGDMTEPYMVEEAKQDVLAYLSSIMN
jgi:hypothetical protein